MSPKWDLTFHVNCCQVGCFVSLHCVGFVSGGILVVDEGMAAVGVCKKPQEAPLAPSPTSGQG